MRVMFELTYRCNFRCKHCYVPKSYRKAGELKTKDVFSILDQLRDIGCFYLGFTGGEPFLREDIFDILWYAKKKGFEVIIYANGSLIDEEKADELARLRPNKVDITIPAMSKDAFERISGVSGSRDRVFKTIDLLRKNGINLGFKTCVLKENESEIKEIQDFAASLNALHRLDVMLLPRLDGSKEPYRYRGGLNEKSVAGNTYQVTRSRSCEIGQDYEKSKLEPRTTNHETLFKCGVGVSQAAITPLGELKMCLIIDYPKYKILNKRVSSIRYQVSGQKNGLRDAWERLKELVAAIKPDKNYQCGKCSLYSYCKWCPARGWLENRNFTSCESESRRWAEVRKQMSEDMAIHIT